MENLNEIWKDIPNYEGLYQASNLGRIRNLHPRYKNRVYLSGIISRYGYLRVSLCKNGCIKQFFIHRLVWEAFNGKIPEGMQVNHINEIKIDNRLSNLNLMTAKMNTNWGTGIKRRADKQSKAILQYTINMVLIKEYKSLSEVHEKFGYSEGNISMCCNNKRKIAYGYIWRYKNGEY